MGADIKTTNLKIYEEIYETSYSLLNQNYIYQVSTKSITLFDQLFSNFQIKSTKYQWMTSIPLMVKKYFGSILEDVRTKSKQQLYMVLDVVLMKNESPDSPEKHQNRFYSKINQTIINQAEKNTSRMVRQSLLFEQDVLMKSSYAPKSSISGSAFRQSIFVGTQLPKNQCIMKQAIFIQNLAPKAQQQISFMVQFYNRFANILEGLMRNLTFCSLLLRHFQESMNDKRTRKKLKTKPIQRSSSLYNDDQKGRDSRQRQKYNQTLLLQQVNDFVELYTAFVWDFYNIDQLEGSKIGCLISYQNINSLILNIVWTRVSWIGNRGSQYQQQLLKNYLLKFTNKNQVTKVKSQVLQICSNMSLNPMKYLKQVTLLYRQIVRGFKNATADDLLLAYKSLFYELAVKDILKTKLRMIEIINSVWNGQKSGQVGYAWITWEAGLGALLQQAQKHKLSELI